MKEIDLYIVHTNEINEDDLSLLPFIREEDFKELNKFHLKDNKVERYVSMYLKRKYIGDFYLGENGKPLSKNIYFNISHSHGLVILGISKDNDIGVDVELVRKVKYLLIQFVSSFEELQYIDKEEKFFDIWTNKEALLKAHGMGIRCRLSDVNALPINDKKTYLDEVYYSHTLKYEDYVISISLKGEDDFKINTVEEDVKLLKK